MPGRALQRITPPGRTDNCSHPSSRTYFRLRHRRRISTHCTGRQPGTLPTMHTLVADHPLVAHKVTKLRDVETDTPTFRALADELVTLLAYEATRHVRVEPTTVRTPLAIANGVRICRPVPLVVPVLRAGLGMPDGVGPVLARADVGFVSPGRDGAPPGAD